MQSYINCAISAKFGFFNLSLIKIVALAMNGDCQFGEHLLTLIAQADRACAFAVFVSFETTF